MAQLLLVDILRSSMNDGPGIRTTVFVKGCPLRCIWCHNPESQSGKQDLSLNTEHCTLCGTCAAVCPNGVHEVADGRHVLHRDRCRLCGTCAAACPSRILKIVGAWWSPEAVVELVLRDKAYYDRSGGGVTISGGEPMTQFDAVRRTLELARAAGIHTCLDTCGQAPLERYQQILPLVDLFLWDYKATGLARHKELTGVDGAMVLANLRALYDAGARIRLRCPLVPGVNDTAEHLKAIATFASAMLNLEGIDLMPYHSFGRTKAAWVGMNQPDIPEQPASQDQIGTWMAELKAMGCERVTLG